MGIGQDVNFAGKSIARGLRAVGGGSKTKGASNLLRKVGIKDSAGMLRDMNKAGSTVTKYMDDRRAPGESRTGALRRIGNSVHHNVKKAVGHTETAASHARDAAAKLASGDTHGASHSVRSGVNSLGMAVRHVSRGVGHVINKRK